MIVELCGDLVEASRRFSVAAAIGNDYSVTVVQAFDLTLKGIHLVAPATVQKEEWRAVSNLTIEDLHAVDAGNQWRTLQRYVRHGTLFSASWKRCDADSGFLEVC